VASNIGACFWQRPHRLSSRLADSGRLHRAQTFASQGASLRHGWQRHSPVAEAVPHNWQQAGNSAVSDRFNL